MYMYRAGEALLKRPESAIEDVALKRIAEIIQLGENARDEQDGGLFVPFLQVPNGARSFLPIDIDDAEEQSIRKLAVTRSFSHVFQRGIASINRTSSPRASPHCRFLKTGLSFLIRSLALRLSRSVRRMKRSFALCSMAGNVSERACCRANTGGRLRSSPSPSRRVC
jgi:hypothetical protein